MRRRSIAWKIGLVVLCLSSAGTASAVVDSLGADELSIAKSPTGHPKVHLDRLEFPTDVPASAQLKSHLKRVLKREVRRVEWGAGRDNRIEYRFSVTKLGTVAKDGVLQVSCAATGALPGGKTAKSQLSFSGAPKRRFQVMKQVLEIVARGVITRLAELERRRRGLR